MAKKNQPNTPSLHHSPRDEIFNGPGFFTPTTCSSEENNSTETSG